MRGHLHQGIFPQNSFLIPMLINQETPVICGPFSEILSCSMKTGFTVFIVMHISSSCGDYNNI